MKSIVLATTAALFILTGCSNNEAQEDYTRCNEEFASDLECTEEEFRDFLILEAEDNAFIIGGIEEATADTQNKIVNEINDKIAEVFE